MPQSRELPGQWFTNGDGLRIGYKVPGVSARGGRSASIRRRALAEMEPFHTLSPAQQKRRRALKALRKQSGFPRE